MPDTELWSRMSAVPLRQLNQPSSVPELDSGGVEAVISPRTPSNHAEVSESAVSAPGSPRRTPAAV